LAEVIWCNHSDKLNADRLPDDTAVLTLESLELSVPAWLIGADVRPDWTPHTSGRIVELWQGERLIVRLPSDDADDDA